jgi:hypothetical protein
MGAVVSSTARLLAAVAAIQRSFCGMGVPAPSRYAPIRPYPRTTSGSNPITSISETKSFSADKRPVPHFRRWAMRNSSPTLTTETSGFSDRSRSR